MYKAIKRVKVQKSIDERGLVAEILKHVPDSFIDILAALFNYLMRAGQAPSDWRKKLFKMLPTTMPVDIPSEYRPIATIRLFYQFFCLHDFGMGGNRSGNSSAKRTTWFSGRQTCEEHLVTAHIVLDKFSSASVPIWIVSLDLPKAFDRVHWPALWRALSEQRLSEHMIWVI